LVAGELLLGLLAAQAAAPEDADDVGVARELVVRLHSVGRVDPGVAVDEGDLAAEDAAAGVELLHRRAQRVRRDRADEGANAREGGNHADLEGVAGSSGDLLRTSTRAAGRQNRTREAHGSGGPDARLARPLDELPARNVLVDLALDEVAFLVGIHGPSCPFRTRRQCCVVKCGPANPRMPRVRARSNASLAVLVRSDGRIPRRPVRAVKRLIGSPE